MRFLRPHTLFISTMLFVIGCGDGGNQTPTGSGGAGGNGGSGGGNVIQIEKPENAIEGQYIFALDATTVTKDTVKMVAEELLAPQGGVLLDVYDGSVMGFFANGLDDAKALAMAKDPRVKGIMQDCVFSLNEVQAGAPWNLDRIDSKTNVLDGNYTYESGNGAGVNVYVIDTGIRRTHQEFEGRAEYSASPYHDNFDATDCQGHGTHVAGTIAGKTYGVAKGATVHSVRAFGCDATTSAGYVLKAIDWVTIAHKKPAIVNMSIGGPANTMIDNAILDSIKAGVIYVAAAGNFNKDACLLSPARIPEVITVGATDKTDTRAPFSNWGTCVDIFAPGVDIDSASKTSDTTVAVTSGTSQATPLVTGTLALYLEKNPMATQADVTAALLGGAMSDLVKDPKGSANKFLYSRFMDPKTGFQDTKVWNTEVFAAEGVFTNPSSYGTQQYADITGDGKDDFCVRYHSAMACMTSSGASFDTYKDWSIYFDDAPFGNDQSNWGTIRLADITGDGKADICGRRGDGIMCAVSDGTAFQNVAIWTPGFADAAGWTDPKYWVSIDFPDVNGDGKADVCGRYSNGVHCGLSTGTGFTTTSIWTPNFDAVGGWDGNVNHWSTIRYPDVNGDGKADVCGRSTLGVFCALSDGTKFAPATQWETSFGNGSGFDVMESYWGTLAYVDVNGDKKMDACARAAAGVYCELSDGNKFNEFSLWSPTFADGSGWAGAQSHWGTIRFPDVNGDGKADLCGRSSIGVQCEVSTGSGFGLGTVWGPSFNDVSGWATQPYHWGTIRYPDLNGDGKADICGMSLMGIDCGLAP